MINARTLLKWARRAVLCFIAVLFATSLFAVVGVEKGAPVKTDFTSVFSANGVVAYADRHIPEGSKNTQSWEPRFDWLSDQQRAGISYRDMFNWSALGFQRISQRYPPRGMSPSISIYAVAVPLWPVLLLLLLPEVGPWLRRARARVIKNMTPAQTQRVESSTIAGDLPCVHCGYNLQTLSTTSLCPECGNAVLDTLTLSAELARSRPSWLKSLAWGNVLLLFARVMILAIFGQFTFSRWGARDYSLVEECAVAAAIAYTAGSFLLTLREHPYLRSPDHSAAIRQRLLAAAVFICVITGAGLLIFPAGPILWDFIPMAQLLLGWLFYCVSTCVEYSFLSKLAGRLLDGFMTEHCLIAGIGAGITNIVILAFTRPLFEQYDFPRELAPFILISCVTILWMLFLLWTGFMNIYCASRFLQQAWLAEEHWRARQASPQIVQR